MLTADMKELALLLADSAALARNAWINHRIETNQQWKTRPSETMDFFNTLDPELDARLIEGITTKFQIDRFLTEEGGSPEHPERNQTGGRRAVIDSLDGSSNLATYRPDFGISVALEYDGRPFLGGIVTPVRGELLVASRGEGTYLFSCYNKTDAEITEAIASKEAVPVTTQSFALKQKKKLDSPLKTSRIYVHTGKRRNFELAPEDSWNTLYPKLANPGCSFCCTVALAEVALGKLDAAAVGFQNPWDYAAGRLLVEEAGGWFEAWSRDWQKCLNNEDLALANATKDEKGDEWLCHILAGGNVEIVEALKEHFLT